MEISKGRGCVYSLEYHVVWCVKYRHKILTEQILSTLKTILLTVCDEIEAKIIEFNGELDHIHILISCKPTHYIPDVVQKLKGVSSRVLMLQFSNELQRKLWGGHIWNPSYFIATVSENTESQIKEYIKNQGR